MLVVSGGALLGVSLGGGPGVGARVAVSRAGGLSALPLAARGPVSAVLGDAQAGYRLSGLRAVNPSQRLRVGFSSAGVTVSSGLGRTELSLIGFGRRGALRELGGALPSVRGNRVVYRRGGLLEWYANGPLGLEQGFSVQERPAGPGNLVAVMSLAGNLRARLDHGGVLLWGAGALLRYGGLLAVDARHRALRAWLSVRDGRLLIAVDDRGAAYPLRIDPLIQQGGKLVGTGASPPFVEQGASVALSGDGRTALIGGPEDNHDAGAAWVFTRSGDTWSQQGPKLVGTGATGDAQQGLGVALSGDGRTALIGGPADNSDAGAAWVFTRSGDTWSQQGAKLVGTGATGDAQQGLGVALSGDGRTALIGGNDDNNYAGATWVFTRSGGA
jgi:hypothetical protein